MRKFPPKRVKVSTVSLPVQKHKEYLRLTEHRLLSSVNQRTTVQKWQATIRLIHSLRIISILSILFVAPSSITYIATETLTSYPSFIIIYNFSNHRSFLPCTTP
ncbi:hypothetical protein O181_025709 [Austropuccinia psidii MF-1]|uniref:Uncharacterized protein n=1 Tax=Austropuccinia psidii MF-1 TaxID=1389203 RepID=A0A9Q3H0X2_9BASI|nr:hypothetical protein [Austropuccinia psidii MF-1]